MLLIIALHSLRITRSLVKCEAFNRTKYFSLIKLKVKIKNTIFSIFKY